MTSVQGKNTVLEARQVSKRFPGVQALGEVSLRVCKGQSLALLGENGAGKSTLMGILAGVIQPDAGEVLIDGLAERIKDPRHAKQLGIATVFQELSLIDNLTVAENLFLGHEPRSKWRLIDYPQMNRLAQMALAHMGLSIAAESLVSSLRTGQRQAVEIARGLSSGAKVLILDEPTSSLSHHETETLFGVLAELRRAGVGLIYITHRLEELPRVADELLVMRDGRVAAAELPADTPAAEIIRAMVGRPLRPLKTKSPTHSATTLFLAKQVTLPHPTRPADLSVDHVDLHVAAGEVLGLFGLVGAGRTELLETFFGVHAARGGEFWIQGERVELRSPSEAIAAGVSLVPEDRKQAGLILTMSVRENATLAALRTVARAGLVRRDAEDEKLMPLFAQVGMSPDKLPMQVSNLSGGNQQKVVLAKWLATRPRILLLDEPTRGIDIGARQEIYALIEQLARSGVAVILASSELSEIMALSDRVMVMREGQVTYEMPSAAATQEQLMQAALPRSRT